MSAKTIALFNAHRGVIQTPAQRAQEQADRLRKQAGKLLAQASELDELAKYLESHR